MAKNILKLTEGNCVVKVSGAPAATTITLATDLKKANETASSPKVAISGITWTGDGTAVITVDRNSVRIMTLHTGKPGQFDFSGIGMIADSVEHGSDIVVTIVGGANAEIWLRLQKVSGYTSSNALLTGVQP